MKTRAFIAISRSDHDGSAEPAQRLATWGICNNNNDPDCTRRADKLYRARSRLYRRRFLQVNMRWNKLSVRKED